MATVLLASLGESPAVVTAMYDLLTRRENLQIDIVDVLYPTGGYVRDAFGLVKEELEGKSTLHCYKLPFEDVNSEKVVIEFLQILYQKLEEYQTNGDTVYLSLAGGRKSMSALIAWISPLFPCIQGLYHVIDSHENDFWLIDDMILEMSDTELRRAMHPDLDQLFLVEIPFGEEQRISQGLREKLLHGKVEELISEGFEEEAVNFVNAVSSNEKVLDVKLTKHAEEQYLEYYKGDFQRARRFKNCFDEMRTPSLVRKGMHDTKKHENITFHFFKKGRTVERPVFYTSPKDIYYSTDDEVALVVVCDLEVEIEEYYPPLKEIVTSARFSSKPEVLAESLPSVKNRTSDESVLIVPLGASPMVATQLCALLLAREEANIKEVMLIYPEKDTIIAGARLIKKALKTKNVHCTEKRIQGLKDIASSKDCLRYQEILENVLEDACERYSKQQVIMALSGGRKGMTAMTIFAAQKAGIPYVYHTLITDEKLDEVITKETTVKALQKLRSDQERNDRLLLRQYSPDEEYSQFALFRMPVFPAGK